jgi:hypothetical protein
VAYPRYRDKEHMDKRQAEPADMVDSAAIAAVGHLFCYSAINSYLCKNYRYKIRRLI